MFASEISRHMGKLTSNDITGLFYRNKIKLSKKECVVDFNNSKTGIKMPIAYISEKQVCELIRAVNMRIREHETNNLRNNHYLIDQLKDGSLKYATQIFEIIKKHGVNTVNGLSKDIRMVKPSL